MQVRNVYLKRILMYHFVSTVPRGIKQLIMLAVDVMLVPVALLAAFVLQHSGAGTTDNLFDELANSWVVLPLLMVLCADFKKYLTHH